jgi:hypothetical protein
MSPVMLTMVRVALAPILIVGVVDGMDSTAAAGLMSHLDCFVITMILPSWHHDVATPYEALAIRRREAARPLDDHIRERIQPPSTAIDPAVT